MVPHRKIIAVLALALTACGSAAADAAGLDCDARRLSRSRMLICQDHQLLRLHQQLDRRVASLGRKVSLGQYLGLRVWNAGWWEERGKCGLDRSCIAATYRAQSRVLDQFQLCFESTLSRRTCLRSTLDGDREAQRR